MARIPDFLRKSDIAKVVPSGKAPSERPIRGPGNQSPAHLRKATAASLAPVTSLDGAKPVSYEDARELMRRAVAELVLQPRVLRRLRKLLTRGNDRETRAAFEAVFEFMRGEKQDGQAGRPTSINISNYVARPGATKSTTTAIDATTVEVVP